MTEHNMELGLLGHLAHAVGVSEPALKLLLGVLAGEHATFFNDHT